MQISLNKLVLSIVLVLFSAQALAVNTSRPDKLVSTLTAKVLKHLKKDKTLLDKNPSQVRKVARKLLGQIKPHWDVVRTSAYIIGKPWRTASRTDKRTFIKEFEDLLIRTYSKALLKYADQRVEMLPYRHVPGKKQAKVKSKFIRSGGSPIGITYSLYRHKSKGWRAYDVTVGGFNLISSFKNQYRPIIKKSGLAGLNKVLKAKR